MHRRRRANVGTSSAWRSTSATVLHRWSSDPAVVDRPRPFCWVVYPVTVSTTRFADHSRSLMSLQTSLAREASVDQSAMSGLPRIDASDALGEIDDVLDGWSARRRDCRRRQVELEDERQEFIRHAEGLAESMLRPSLQAIAQRLKACGGDGALVERPRDAFHDLRLTLWMALDRKVAVFDRPDIYPYIRLDVDVPRRRFTVWEGDMWERQGASRPTDPWELNEITAPFVTERVVAILRRAAGHKVFS